MNSNITHATQNDIQYLTNDVHVPQNIINISNSNNITNIIPSNDMIDQARTIRYNYNLSNKYDSNNNIKTTSNSKIKNIINSEHYNTFKPYTESVEYDILNEIKKN